MTNLQDEQSSQHMDSSEETKMVSSVVRSEQDEESPVYFVDEQPIDLESAFAAPFPLSGEMPAVSTPAQSSGDYLAPVQPGNATPAKKPGSKPRVSLLMVAILICVVVIIGMVAMSALAQATPPLQTTQQRNTATVPAQPTPDPTQTGQGQTQQPDWVPQQLPDGWTNAGLLSADALQAERTGTTFTDREMSLDYRSVGTRTNHGGSLTAATFLLTPAALQRFTQNDVRVVNNTLFDMVEKTQLVRVVINPQPQLVKFAQSGQQQFAWVNVSFQFWQSRLDPNHPGQRVDGKDLVPNTNQPVTHHMIVLLLHVPAQNAGNNPAMGGTSWLVSTYAFDPANGTLPDIIRPA